MVKGNYIKAGRLVRVLRGPRADHVGFITDIVDANRILVENPEDPKMWLHVQNLRNIEPLKFSLPIRRGANTKLLKEALEKKKVLQQWDKTQKCRAIKATKALAEANDFERYQLRAAKRSHAHWSRKLFDEMDKKQKLSWHQRKAKTLEKAHNKFQKKKMKERHDRIKKFFKARKAKKASKKTK